MICGFINDVQYSMRKYDKCDGSLLEAVRIYSLSFTEPITAYRATIETVFYRNRNLRDNRECEAGQLAMMGHMNGYRLQASA